MTMQERLRELGGDMGPEAADYIDELEAYADKLAAYNAGFEIGFEKGFRAGKLSMEEYPRL